MLTVRELDRTTDGGFKVVVVDDALPDQEGEFLLRYDTRTDGFEFLEVESFTLRMRKDLGIGERINASLLKLVPFGRWVSAAVAAASDLDKDRDTDVWMMPDPQQKMPQIRPAPRLDLDLVATLYRIYIRTSSVGPAEEIAKAFKVSLPQAQQWVMHARRAGFLGPIAPRKRRIPDWARGLE